MEYCVCEKSKMDDYKRRTYGKDIHNIYWYLVSLYGRYGDRYYENGDYEYSVSENVDESVFQLVSRSVIYYQTKSILDETLGYIGNGMVTGGTYEPTLHPHEKFVNAQMGCISLNENVFRKTGPSGFKQNTEYELLIGLKDRSNNFSNIHIIPFMT